MKIKNIFYVFIIFIINFFIINQVSAIHIISRQEWWADESLRYIDNPAWVKIIKKRKEAYLKNKWKKLTEAQIEARKKRAERLKKMYEHINKYFSDENKLTEYHRYENWHKLAWPIEKTNFVKAIIIHHTHSEYKDSLTWIRSIYRFHTLSRQWWDIWYNYLIWYNWEIFEWRKGWDYVVWAQAKWNNRATIWISIIWDYDEKWLNPKQLKSLEQLIYYLAKKYWIDFNKKVYFHRTCVWKTCKAPLYSFKKYPLVWHRDVGHTTCPWNDMYSQLNTILHHMQIVTKWFKRKYYKWKNFSSKIKTKKINITKKTEERLRKYFSKIPEHKMLLLWERLEEIYDKTYDFETLQLIQKIKDIFLQEAKKRTKIKNTKIINSFDKTHEIRVKLSYPWEKNILIAKDAKIYDIQVKNNKLLVDWEEKNIFVINADNNSKKPYLEIVSWERKPSWDKTWKYNDNKFRWSLIIYVKNNKLEVVNKLKLYDYLKWLWEISNSAPKEKIKTIIIAARTYARWYMTKAKKFKWKNIYQASDDPDVFQKYLGYGYELRSPRVNSVVEETTDEIITYNWKIIKPWYFNKSNWYTKSFVNYCKKASLVPDCSHPKDFPYLASVKDPWSKKSKYYFWHWVWISWAWASYFAKKWWTAEMIIKYFLTWVNIEKK